MEYKQLPDEIDIHQLIEEKIYRPLRHFQQISKDWLYQNSFKLAFLGFCAFLAFKRDINFSINLGNNHQAFENQAISQPSAQAASLDISKNLLSQKEATWSSPIEKKRPPIIMTEKTKKQLAYVERFAKVAQEEMRQFNIPASITLAQGIIETNAGQSPLAKKNNNHFGIKCFSKSCKKGHCSNFSDDSHKDFFRKYNSSWESFRAHSKLLTYKRYKHLTKLEPTDYKNWAIGLKKAGYATDKNYHKKLIQLIEDLHLDTYDVL